MKSLRWEQKSELSPPACLLTAPCDLFYSAPAVVRKPTGPPPSILQQAKWRLGRPPLQTSAPVGCLSKGPKVCPKGSSWSCYLRTLVRALLTLPFPRWQSTAQQHHDLKSRAASASFSTIRPSSWPKTSLNDLQSKIQGQQEG